MGESPVDHEVRHTLRWAPGVYRWVLSYTHMNVDVAMVTVNNLQSCRWKAVELRPGTIWLL